MTIGLKKLIQRLMYFIHIYKGVEKITSQARIITFELSCLQLQSKYVGVYFVF